MMMQKRKRVLLFGGSGIVLIFIGVFAWTSYGQFGRSQYTSPPANVAATIAGKKITIEYYAPSMHGRKIMGGLVPFGEVWCTGANWATKITTEANSADGHAETSRRELQHLDASERERMDADHQQADGAVPQGLRFFDRFRPHEDEFENARRRPSKRSRSNCAPTAETRARWRSIGKRRKRRSRSQ